MIDNDNDIVLTIIIIIIKMINKQNKNKTNKIIHRNYARTLKLILRSSSAISSFLEQVYTFGVTCL